MASRHLDDALLRAAHAGNSTLQGAIGRCRARATAGGLTSAAVGIRAMLEDLQRRGVTDATAIYDTVRGLADELDQMGKELDVA